MIHRISSTLGSFKTLDFHSGLNVLLADKSLGATDRQTRNGAGKTSLIEIIHFLMGANCKPDSIFRVSALEPYSFEMDFDLAGKFARVQRSGAEYGKIWLEYPSQWLFGSFVANNEWKTRLNRLMFQLSAVDEESKREKFEPSFRSLFSYFARRQSDGGFTSPIKHSNNQQPWDWQVSVTFLLGLDWTIPQRFQFIREREKGLEELKKAATEGVLKKLIGATADLRTEWAKANRRLESKRESLKGFRVLPQYHELQGEADDLKRQFDLLDDDGLMDRQLLAALKDAIRDEKPPATIDLEHLYEEVGIVLPNAATRRFEELREFHESVVQNRKLYLQGEIEAVRERIAEREKKMKAVDKRKAQIMSLLQSHGALDQYTKLQTEVSRLEAEAEMLKRRFEAAEELEEQRTKVGIERGELFLQLQKNYREQEETLKRAIQAFEDASSDLYENAGSLMIKESPKGPVFEVKIHGAQSKGINNMQIFCFDMMLMRLCVERGIGPGFLIHDSHLFDGVDERQVAKALQIGARTAERLGFQYIVTMNSDALPKEGFSDGFEINDHILPIRLTDATENGGLFGIRFK